MQKRMTTAIMKLAATFAFSLFLPVLAQGQTKPEVDAALKPYQAQGKSLSGKLEAGSSETLKRLMDLWVEGFVQHHKKVTIETSLIKYSEATQAALPDIDPIPEGAKLLALSHPLSEANLGVIRAKLGVEPIQVPVALDAIVLVVHHRNPLQGVTLSQVKTIFGATSNNVVPAPQPWQDYGLNSKLATRDVNLYGRDKTAGTFAAFKEMALKGSEQRSDVHIQPGSMSVVMEVGSDEAGIGYASTGFAVRSKKVRVVPIAQKEGDPYISPTNETVVNGAYPLSRKLYLYAMPQAGGKLDPSVKDFILFVLSKDGQHLAKEDGFFPLPSHIVEQALSNLEKNGGLAAGIPAH
jgi:phosphate transport system substrate-binding protein